MILSSFEFKIKQNFFQKKKKKYKEFPNVIEIEDPVHGEIKELVYKLDKKGNSQKEELV
jgi:hypothetical protein